MSSSKRAVQSSLKTRRSLAERAAILTDRTVRPFRRRLRDSDTFEASLADASLELEPHVRGKSIALVGNARSLIDGPHQPIDSHDLVARVNRGPQVAQKCGTIGSRTDILFVGGLELGIEMTVAIRRLKAPPTHRVFVGVRDRDLLPGAIARTWSFYPRAWWQETFDELGARPSSGMMAIDLLTRILGAGELHLYGFDFFRTPTTHTGKMLKRKHHPPAEELFARRRVPVERIHGVPDIEQPTKGTHEV